VNVEVTKVALRLVAEWFVVRLDAQYAPPCKLNLQARRSIAMIVPRHLQRDWQSGHRPTTV